MSEKMIKYRIRLCRSDDIILSKIISLYKYKTCCICSKLIAPHKYVCVLCNQVLFKSNRSKHEKSNKHMILLNKKAQKVSPECTST